MTYVPVDWLPLTLGALAAVAVNIGLHILIVELFDLP